MTQHCFAWSPKLARVELYIEGDSGMSVPPAKPISVVKSGRPLFIGQAFLGPYYAWLRWLHDKTPEIESIEVVSPHRVVIELDSSASESLVKRLITVWLDISAEAIGHSEQDRDELANPFEVTPQLNSYFEQLQKLP